MEGCFQREPVYVAATTLRSDEPARVLKAEDTFGIFDRHGDIHQVTSSEQGLYHGGTRYLSHLELRINGQRPLILNSTIKKDNSLLVVDMTMPDLYEGEVLVIPRGSVHVFRSVVLASSARHEHLRLVNYSDQTVVLNVEFRFAGDYRTFRSPRRTDGLGVPCWHRRSRKIPWCWVTGLTASCGERTFDSIGIPDQINDSCCSRLRLGVHGESLHVTISCLTDGAEVPTCDYYQAIDRIGASIAAARSSVGHIVTSNEQSTIGLAGLPPILMLVANGPRAAHAGVPWFSTPFGRDIITALQTLWIRPSSPRVSSPIWRRPAESWNPNAMLSPARFCMSKVRRRH